MISPPLPFGIPVILSALPSSLVIQKGEGIFKEIIRGPVILSGDFLQEF
jgi:hypothetical protein